MRIKGVEMIIACCSCRSMYNKIKQINMKFKEYENKIANLHADKLYEEYYLFRRKLMS